MAVKYTETCPHCCAILRSETQGALSGGDTKWGSPIEICSSCQKTYLTRRKHAGLMSSGAFKFEMAKRLVGQFIAVCMYFSVFGIIAALVFAWITGKDGKEQFNFIVPVIGGLIVGFIYMGFTVVPFIKEYRDWRPDFYLSCLWKLRVNSVKQSPELLALLRELESKAIVLESREGKLLFKPRKNVTPEIIGKLTKHKAALLRMLK